MSHRSPIPGGPPSERRPDTTHAVQVSVVVIVGERPSPLEEIYTEYSSALTAAGRSHEFLFVVPPWGDGMTEPLKALAAQGEPVRVFRTNHRIADAMALRAVGQAARGDILLTLPAYHRVAPRALDSLIERLDHDVDLASARRIPGGESLFNRLQRRVFHTLVRWGTGGRLTDIASGVNALRAEILDDIPLHGALFRFLPILVQHEGFVVEEVDAAQHPGDHSLRIHSPGVYLRRVVDLLGLLFLVRFTRKPLRFFGLQGAVLFGVGAVILGVVFVQRVGGDAIADRPLLLLGVLLVVLGLQAGGIGLVGELIVHLDAFRHRGYRIREDSGAPPP